MDRERREREGREGEKEREEQLCAHCVALSNKLSASSINVLTSQEASKLSISFSIGSIPGENGETTGFIPDNRFIPDIFWKGGNIDACNVRQCTHKGVIGSR